MGIFKVICERSKNVIKIPGVGVLVAESLKSAEVGVVGQ